MVKIKIKTAEILTVSFLRTSSLGAISSDLYLPSGCDIEKLHFPLARQTKEKCYLLSLYTKPLTKSVWVSFPEFLLVCEIIFQYSGVSHPDKKKFIAKYNVSCIVKESSFVKRMKAELLLRSLLASKANKRAQSIVTPLCNVSL